jgi:hypothetical protein
MSKDMWLLLLVACLLTGCSAAVPSYAAVGTSNAAVAGPAPSEPLVAGYIGKTTIRTTDSLALRLAWEVNAAEGEAPPTDVVWKLDGRVVSKSRELSISLPAAGEYALELNYRDALGRSCATMVTVRVMEPEEYDAMLQAVEAAAHLSLWMVDEQDFLPLVIR